MQLPCQCNHIRTRQETYQFNQGECSSLIVSLNVVLVQYQIPLTYHIPVTNICSVPDTTNIPHSSKKTFVLYQIPLTFHIPVTNICSVPDTTNIPHSSSKHLLLVLESNCTSGPISHILHSQNSMVKLTSQLNVSTRLKQAVPMETPGLHHQSGESLCPFFP